MSKYRVLLGFNWWSKLEDRKRADGEDYVEQRAEPGDTVTTKQLAGADIKGLVVAGAIVEKVVI